MQLTRALVGPTLIGMDHLICYEMVIDIDEAWNDHKNLE